MQQKGRVPGWPWSLPILSLCRALTGAAPSPVVCPSVPETTTKDVSGFVTWLWQRRAMALPPRWLGSCWRAAAPSVSGVGSPPRSRIGPCRNRPAGCCSAGSGDCQRCSRSAARTVRPSRGNGAARSSPPDRHRRARGSGSGFLAWAWQLIDSQKCLTNKQPREIKAAHVRINISCGLVCLL